VAVLAFDERGRLLLRTEYGERSAARLVGGRWDPKLRAWVLPAPDPGIISELSRHIPLYGTQEVASWLERERSRSRHLAALHEAKDALVRRPEGLDPYQRVGVRFLADAGRAILADEMGLGKTAQAVRAAEEVGAATVLVVCPKSLILNWLREIDRWASCRLAAPLWSDDTELPAVPWIVTNYDALRKHLPALLAWRPEVLIVDEAAAIKNRKTQRAEAVHALAKVARYCWLLTGTPVRNNPAELWSLLHALYPARYTSYWRWVERHCVTARNPWGGVDILRVRDEDRLREELAPLMLRRTKALLGLPPKTRETVLVGMTPEQGRLYRQMRDLFLAAVDKEKVVTAPSVLAQLTRLRQICCSPALIGGPDSSGKTDAVIDIVEANADAHKILVFSTFAEYVKLLCSKLQRWGTVGITGDMAAQDRDEAARRFTEDPDCRVLVGTVTAMGEGLNLQAADLVVFANRDWTPAVNEQAEDRAHRRGQDKPVHVITLVTAGTVEEHVEDLIGRKLAVIAQVLAERLRSEVASEV